MLPFQIELTRLTLGFAQAPPPPLLVKCKTFQATRCAGVAVAVLPV